MATKDRHSWAGRTSNIGARIGAMNREADNVGQASRLPVRAGSLPAKCSAGKDARKTGSPDGCPTTAQDNFMLQMQHKTVLNAGVGLVRALTSRGQESRLARRPASPGAWRTTTRFFIALVLALLTLGLTGCFKVSSDVRALRESVMKSGVMEWNQEIELGVGAITLNLARAGLAFVDLPPEARAALHAARGAEVGVYRLRDARKPLNRAALLSAADKAMAGRGWDRIVGVLDQCDLVAIYMPNDVRSARDVKICLLTLSGEEMVIACARSNLEPLMEMARQAEWHQKVGLPIHF